ncbi:integrase [Clostridia bacterium]|nr:integrase [Clostridia bacterium]GHU74670.1 integrase [Clostridia bacterium]
MSERKTQTEYFHELKGFRTYLIRERREENTVESYMFTMWNFFSQYDEINERNLKLFKLDLMERRSPRTVNLRIAAVNQYLKFTNRDYMKLSGVSIQGKSFLQNVISTADYMFLKNSLLEDGDMDGYFTIWLLGATGARVSEIVRLKVEHVQSGIFEVYGKGNKMRNIYIPKALKYALLKWLWEQKRDKGYLFAGAAAGKNGGHITTRAIYERLQVVGRRYDIDKRVMHPHAFRHFFGKNFIINYPDISLLSDLMGHSNIETTRIYTRRSAEEQLGIVNKVVTW